MEQTVFISVFQPFISRNILHAGVLDALLQRGLRVVLFVPEKKASYYQQFYANKKNVVIEPIAPALFLNRKNDFFKGFAQLLIDTNTKRFHRMQEYARTGGRIRYKTENVLCAFLSKSATVKALFRALEDRFNFNPVFAPYFGKYSPLAVFAPDMMNDADLALIRAAKRSGVPNTGMILSWDNLTSKGLMRSVPGTLIVQNEIIRDEALTLHAIDRSRIVVSGIPHYDYYAAFKPRARADALRSLGIDPEKKVVFLSPAGSQFVDTDWQIFEILKRASADGRIKRDVNFVLSQHPTNPLEYGSFEPNERFVVKRWGVTIEGVRLKDTEFSRSDIDELLNILCNVDVVVNVVSSMVIDAAVLDKPIVTVGFEGWEKKVPFTRSVKRFLSEENMSKLLSIGGTRVAHNADELIEYINRYLDDPTLDAEKRRELARRQCWRLDGKSADRITDAIMGSIHHD